MSRMVVRRALATAILRLARWRTVGTLPSRGVVVGAPHTSNWDWVFSLLFAWSQGHHPRIMVKQEFFRGPLAPVLRVTGGISINRAHPTADVRALLQRIETGEEFLLTVAAEGTRSKGEHWKSGFHRIARQTGLPITLAFIDGPSRTVGAGPTFAASEDLAADMERIREFYADKRGIHPGNRTEPRLRNE